MEYSGMKLGIFNCIGSVDDKDGTIKLFLKCDACGKEFTAKIKYDIMDDGSIQYRDITRIKCDGCGRINYIVKFPVNNEIFIIKEHAYRELSKSYKDGIESGEIAAGISKSEYIYIVRRKGKGVGNIF